MTLITCGYNAIRYTGSSIVSIKENTMFHRLDNDQLESINQSICDRIDNLDAARQLDFNNGHITDFNSGIYSGKRKMLLELLSEVRFLQRFSAKG